MWKVAYHFKIKTLTCYLGKATAGRSNGKNYPNICVKAVCTRTVCLEGSRPTRGTSSCSLLTFSQHGGHQRKPGDTVPPMVWPGYYQVTILGINKQISVDAAYFPVTSSDEPRAVSLPQDPHGNTMLSCLSSSFLCPLIDAASHSETTHPEPEEVLVTASELEDTHVVCILDLCHLGGDKVEVLINKVYRVTEVCLDLVL
ncbi:RPA-related protein RADX [Larimichthys crocea]|uniref:Uncharacterized protein n=1 Tax=Larimichthys crocea TaxID=215358 RepID=A0ACD3R5A8_LARCR|nr:RPA-related protein RADX [Larimichthys crocea]